MLRETTSIFSREKKNIGAQFSKYYIPLCCPFLNWWSCWLHLRRTKQFLVAAAPLLFLMDAEKNNFSKTFARISRYSIWKKYDAPVFHS